VKGTVVVPRPLARDFFGLLTVEMPGLYECTGTGIFFTLTVKLIRLLGVFGWILLFDCYAPRS
jgi:hypothetical protein